MLYKYARKREKNKRFLKFLLCVVLHSVIIEIRMFTNLKYHSALHVIIFIWGFTGILGKWIKIDAIGIVWYRVVIAFVSLFILMVLVKRKLIIPDKRVALQTLGVGVLVALHWLTFYISIKESTASLAIVCLATATIHVSWLEPLVMKRKFRATELILGIIIITGILLITSDSNSEGQTIGIVYGLISALLAALFSTFNGHLIGKTKASTLTLYEMFSASVLLTICLLVSGGFTHLPNTGGIWDADQMDLLWLLFLGIVCTSIAFLVTVEITKYLGAFTVTLSINMEPIYTLIIAAISLNENEKVGDYFYYGAALIVGAVFLNGIYKYVLKENEKRLSRKHHKELV